MLFLKKLFNIPDWDVHIKNGKMIRICRYSGNMEYRDCKSQQWLPLQPNDTTHQLGSPTTAPDLYQVDMLDKNSHS